MQRSFSEQEGYCAPKTFTEAAGWLQRHREKKFFLYVDTWDPHEPWDPPAYYVKPYLPDYQGQVVHPVYWDFKEDGLSEADVAIAHACYQGEISMVDHWFGFLIERLRVFNLLDDTAILFLSDHGFYFGEHGWLGKRRFRWPDGSSFDAGFSKGLKMGQQTVYRSPLHNEITRVPLVMHLPGTAARRVPGVVSLPDVMPTVLEIAGVPVPERVQGSSLLSMARGEASGVHDLVVTCAPFEEIGQISKTVDDRTRVVQEISPCSITDGEWDLLYAVNNQPVELFNRQSDPGHHHNVFDSQRQVAERLHSGFVRWMEANGAPEDQIEMRRRLD
jgi:arylsulfatase A-like enzyme